MGFRVLSGSHYRGGGAGFGKGRGEATHLPHISQFLQGSLFEESSEVKAL